jgi:hypothetical protein
VGLFYRLVLSAVAQIPVLNSYSFRQHFYLGLYDVVQPLLISIIISHLYPFKNIANFSSSQGVFDRFSRKQCLAKYSDLVVRIPAANINRIATHPVYARLKNCKQMKGSKVTYGQYRTGSQKIWSSFVKLLGEEKYLKITFIKQIK